MDSACPDRKTSSVWKAQIIFQAMSIARKKSSTTGMRVFGEGRGKMYELIGLRWEKEKALLGFLRGRRCIYKEEVMERRAQANRIKLL